MPAAAVPDGFVRFVARGADVVCMHHVADAFRAALASGTLGQYAESHPQTRGLMGRGVVYAVPLPGDIEHVVIRHNRHGGLFAPITRDLFRAPTRAPRELLFSERLHEYGVPTPRVLGYVLYDALPGFRRVDVVTRLVPDSFDLAVAFMSDDAALRARAIAATTDLLITMATVGARHIDLNVKNVLLQRGEGGTLSALVLDLDRVVFDEPEIVFDLNLERLLRSARKWQTLHGARLTAAELDELAWAARERRPPPMPLSTSS